MKLLLEAERTGYSTYQVGKTMTVRDLISYLENYDDSTPVYISNDNGYTYGAIREYDFREVEEDEEEDE